ncbi:MAG: hypothetical protein LBT52_05235, partial [Clostridiales Family XIII bacterium]|nr:hypothetical protein [Clostridiales Family XIII bacterium]
MSKTKTITKSRALSILLALSLVLSVFTFAPMSASAAGVDPLDIGSGTFSWDGNGKVVIDGTGLTPEDFTSDPFAAIDYLADLDVDPNPALTSADVTDVVIDNANATALRFAASLRWA